MVKNKSGVYQFSSLVQYGNLVHGFSNRAFGSFKHEEVQKNVANFASALGIPSKQIVFMDQVHGNTVTVVNNFPPSSFIKDTDGMVTSKADCYLCVRTADCVPLLAFDPTKGVCGVAHAGWKGVLANIPLTLIEAMKDVGADIANVRIGIGPSIRVCCYAIDEHRASQFISAFPRLADTILVEKGGKMYLNLQQLVTNELITAGVIATHIEDSEICTYDASSDFFSYRAKDTHQGLFGGIIGVKHV